jgi:prefoldin subunit 5
MSEFIETLKEQLRAANSEISILQKEIADLTKAIDYLTLNIEASNIEQDSAK